MAVAAVGLMAVVSLKPVEANFQEAAPIKRQVVLAITPANRRLYESNPELGAASVYFRLPQSAPATTAPSSAAPKAATLPGVNAAALLPTRFQLAGTP